MEQAAGKKKLNHRSTTTSGDGLDAAVTAGTVTAAPAVTKERQTRLSASLSAKMLRMLDLQPTVPS